MEFFEDRPERDLWSGFVSVDADGGIRLPREVVRRYRPAPGSRIYVEAGDGGMLLHRPVDDLARVYVEPTNTCNLSCRTCVRRVWEEPLGHMEMGTFQKVLRGVGEIDPRPELFFGGFGEPLGNPDILAMVRLARQAGASTQLITNGVLLDEGMSRGLIDAGLDFLWVSLDGATPESYLDVRLGDELPGIIENLRMLRRLRYHTGSRTPGLGIAFVAMKRNLGDLPRVISLGRRLGVRRFHVSNLLPYTGEMRGEVLCARSLRERIQAFDFSPCTICNSCELAESNTEDCFGNQLPACGGCLWAQGFISCP